MSEGSEHTGGRRRRENPVGMRDGGEEPNGDSWENGDEC
jgi:hypothetical protein